MGERPPTLRRLLSALVLLVVGALLPFMAWGGSSTAVAAAEEPGLTPPNTTLQGIIPTSVCCPSRAALLSGQYARTTGVYQNTGTNGGWPTFYASGAESRTIAVELTNSDES